MRSQACNGKCPENDEEQKCDDKKEKNYYKKEIFNGNCYHCGRKVHRVENCYDKINEEKKNEKQKRLLMMAVMMIW